MSMFNFLSNVMPVRRSGGDAVPLTESQPRVAPSWSSRQLAAYHQSAEYKLFVCSVAKDMIDGLVTGNQSMKDVFLDVRELHKNEIVPFSGKFHKSDAKLTYVQDLLTTMVTQAKQSEVLNALESGVTPASIMDLVAQVSKDEKGKFRLTEKDSDGNVVPNSKVTVVLDKFLEAKQAADKPDPEYSEGIS